MMPVDLSGNWLSAMVVVGMILFLLIFTGAVVWVLTRPKRQVNRWSRLPLSDESKHS